VALEMRYFFATSVRLSGDKIFYNYQATGTMKDNAFQAEENKYQITGGTGKMKGIKGAGTCKTTGTADGGLEYTCTGEYTLAGTAPVKNRSRAGEIAKDCFAGLRDRPIDGVN
jgi:hypothetical protein